MACSTRRIPSIQHTSEGIQYNEAASWNNDPTGKEYYYGFGCTIVSIGGKIRIGAAFTQAKQSSQESAMRVKRDVLAVETQA